jgi:alkylation response protein AidB-like acyl-CoA dehydrogenase
MRLTTDQNEFQDLLKRFFSERIASEYLRERINKGLRNDPNLEQDIRELGVWDTFSSEQPACGVVELALLAEECGRALVPDSLVERVVAESLLESLLKPQERAAWAEALAGAGGSLVAFNDCCELSVAPSSALGAAGQGAFTGDLSGTAQWAVGSSDALGFVGFATADGGRRAVIAKLGSAANTPQVERQTLPSLDLTTPLTKLTFTNAPCAILSPESTEALEVALETLKASEVSGICQRVISMTTEYVKTREQFGAPIGSFQAIQQKLAQVYAESEALGSLCRFAAWSFSASPEQRRLTSRAAILKAADVGPMVCEVAIQCHGGIGFTWEYDLHLYLRRAKTIQAAFGITDERAAGIIGAVS